MKLSLVPHEARFFELFNREAALVRESLSELAASLADGRSRHGRLRDLEHECDDVALEIYNLTNRTFTTPMEPEDILLLAHSLDGLVDMAEETADKIDLYKARPIRDHACQLGRCLAAAGVELEKALAKLEDPQALGPILQAIHTIENDGDRITRDALQQLFNAHETSIDMIKWKDLYDLLETTIDECESVAEIIETIAIKSA